ncbi:hypothetical protein C8R41DRAFT_306469 [Lentinula lateritia]|uniref:Uncharacterized protein n=1 Tax=Lentinula lateritia TaxID=40482 RepID=A0ABQ8VMU6_9AGAR|nr:hypothetical protein C8R41DRAFT_306469 [Lentinula lateritia]
MNFLATSAVGLATFTAVSVFTVGTGYGAIAVREYFSDEPTNWRAEHYIFLFLTPLRLVYPFMNLGTFTPFFFLWPTIPPYSVWEQLTAESRRLDGRSTLIFTPEDHDNTTCDWMVAKHILVHTVEAWSRIRALHLRGLLKSHLPLLNLPPNSSSNLGELSFDWVLRSIFRGENFIPISLLRHP